MPVTEFALLSLKHAVTGPSVDKPTQSPENVFKNLRYAGLQQAAHSGYPVTLLQCHEDPTQIYLIGGWKTVEAHMNEWIPGQTNQELMGLLGKDIDVERMFHLDCAPERVVSLLRKVEGADGIVAVARHFVKDGSTGRKGFSETWTDNKDALEKYTEGGKDGLVGGWRIDIGFEGDTKGEDDGKGRTKTMAEVNEFVLLTAWGCVQDHMDFAGTEDFKKYGKIRDHLERAEVRHGKVIFVAES